MWRRDECGRRLALSSSVLGEHRRRGQRSLGGPVVLPAHVRLAAATLQNLPVILILVIEITIMLM
jgi:hypothetical protein